MDAYHMYLSACTRHIEHTVQQAAAGTFKPGHIQVFPGIKRELAEDGIAVVTGIINGVFTVGLMWPELVRQKFVLGHVRPVFCSRLMTGVLAVDLLQKGQIHIGCL